LGLGLFPAGIVFDEWGGLLMLANIFGLCLTVFAYFKALTFPTHRDDCKWSGSVLYDMFMGVELNPRLFGDRFDFKLFFNGRPGIVGWTLINFSFACKQVGIILLHCANPSVTLTCSCAYLLVDLVDSMITWVMYPIQ
jgi:7-dehydrocholesterol reductase